jgi:hypothetical protein
MDRHQLTQHLLALSDADLLNVLEQVFQHRRPNPEEDHFNHNCYFLGTASQMLTSESDEPEIWGKWEHEAVAYKNRTAYPDTFEPNEGFCQFGTCQQCSTAVRSYVKKAICPICGTPVYLT